jgi:hypothetical protein
VIPLFFKAGGKFRLFCLSVFQRNEIKFPHLLCTALYRKKIISQFTRPVRSTVNSAELGLKAFSNFKRDSQFFLHCSSRLLPNQSLTHPIGRLSVDHSITQSINHSRLSFISQKRKPPLTVPFYVLSPHLVMFASSLCTLISRFVLFFFTP